MGFVEERGVLESWFSIQWAGLQPLTDQGLENAIPIEYQGQLFTPPDDGGPYMTMEIIGDLNPSTIEIGTRPLARYVGVIQFTISVPVGDDQGPGNMARRIGDVLDGLFSNRRFELTNGQLRCRFAGFHALGVTENQRYTAVLSVPYVRDGFGNVPTPVLLIP